MEYEIELKRLTDEVNKTFQELKTYNDQAIKEAETRNGQATAETRTMVDKLNNTITELRNEIAELQKKSQRPQMGLGNDDIGPEEELRRSAFVKFLRFGIGETGRTLMSPEEQRALAGTSDADGGFLIPPSFESGIIMNAYDLAEIRPLCQVGQTGRDVVVLGSLSKPSVAWGRQSIAVTQQSLTTGVRRITVYDLRALTLIANNTLDDADANIVSEMTDAFGRAIAEAEDDAFAVGAGDDSPQGIAADTTVQANYAASGVAAALSDATHNGVDPLISAFYKIKKTYRKNGTWAFNSTTEGVIRTLKDGEGRYLWQPPVSADVPATLLGKPVINPEGMADIGANAYPIVFGDFKAGYKIRDRAGISVQRLVERYAEYDQTGFLVKKRVGGMCTLPEAFSCVKIAAS
jgi:HK97 family phage major capsid protein